MKRKTRKKVTLIVGVFIGATFAYFMYLTWLKLTQWVGNSDIVWGITGGILVLALLSGYFSLNKIIERFL